MTIGSEEARRLAHSTQSRYQMSPGARQIILVRHGSTTGHTVDTIELGELTISDPPLTEDGHAQAKAMAGYLSAEPISAIFVTPLKRTHQTAAPLAAATGLTPVVIDDLREVHLGDWEHSFYEHARAGHPLVHEMMVQETWEIIPNSEPMELFAERLRKGITAIVDAMVPGTTAVSISHGGTINELCRQATSSRPFAFNAPENCSVSRLIVEENGNWKLRSFNDVSHLGYA
jgi:probable phosphoglycerate mutase